MSVDGMLLEVPTVLRAEGYRFFFFSNERQEPPHIHVEHGDGTAKFWLLPVGIAKVDEMKAQELKRARELVQLTLRSFWRSGMNENKRAADVRFIGDQLVVDLVDGGEVSVPLESFPRLLQATREQRANWRLIGRGVGIHWPDVDEDISVQGLRPEMTHTFVARGAETLDVWLRSAFVESGARQWLYISAKNFRVALLSEVVSDFPLGILPVGKANAISATFTFPRERSVYEAVPNAVPPTPAPARLA